MKARLLDYLVCPVSKHALELTVTEEVEGEIVEGRLFCTHCERDYPVQRGIPRFVGVSEIPDDQHRTAQAFGWQWTHFTEMHDEFEAQFLDWIAPVQPEFFEGKVVLDAGCGIGRHMFYALKYGAQDVIGIDISNAVETSYQAVAKGHPRAHVVQADIMNLPFREGTFDFIYSIGVLHHLPDPPAGFQSLRPNVKPGGTLLAWVYGYENNWVVHYFIDPLRKHVTTRLPYPVLRLFSFLLAVILQVTVKGIYRPLNHLGFRRLPYNSYLYHLSGFRFHQNYTIVFDHLVAPTAFYIRREEFENWFERANLTQIEISARNQNSWRGRGVVPFSGAT